MICTTVKICKDFSKCCVSISYEKNVNTIYILFSFVNILSAFLVCMFKNNAQNEQSVKLTYVKKAQNVKSRF